MPAKLPTQKRVFKGIWIPKEIWLNPNLTPIEKLLLVEVDSLDNEDEKGCFASNEYFGKFFGLSEGRIANMISSLKKRDFLFQVFFDGRNRGLRVHENVKAGLTKKGNSVHENVKPELTKRGKPISRKREHNNTENKPSNNPTTESETDDADGLKIELHDNETPGAKLLDFLPSESKEKTPPDSAPPPNKEKESPAESSPRRYDAFDIDVDAEKLKQDQICRDRFGRDLKIGFEKATCDFPVYVDRFVENQKSETFNYPNTKEFRKHFFNWIPKVYGNNQPGNQAQVRNGNGQPTQNLTSKMRQL